MSIWWKEDFLNACYLGDIQTIKLLIKNGNHADRNKALSFTCAAGYKEVVELLIEKGANDFNWGLRNACYGGYIDLVKLMIEKGADNWNQGLSNACYSGNKEIVELMISKGADFFTNGLYNACSKNHKELVLFLLLKHVNIDHCSIKLDFEDIYYLSLKGIKEFGKFNDIALECQKWKIEFQHVSNELFIKDIANIIVDY